MWSPASQQTVQRLIEARLGTPGALLPILHDVQDALGHVPAEAVADIAQALNLSRAEVHGVVTFYHHFQTQPPARHTLQLCRAEACQSMGANGVWHDICQRLGLDALKAARHGATTADGQISVQPVYCLGLCSSAPAAAWNGQPRARVNADQLQGLVAASREVQP